MGSIENDTNEAECLTDGCATRGLPMWIVVSGTLNWRSLQS